MTVEDRQKMGSGNSITFAVVIAVVIILGVLVFLDIGVQKGEKDKPVTAPQKTENSS